MPFVACAITSSPAKAATLSGSGYRVASSAGLDAADLMCATEAPEASTSSPYINDGLSRQFQTVFALQMVVRARVGGALRRCSPAGRFWLQEALTCTSLKRHSGALRHTNYPPARLTLKPCAKSSAKTLSQ